VDLTILKPPVGLTVHGRYQKQIDDPANKQQPQSKEPDGAGDRFAIVKPVRAQESEDPEQIANEFAVGVWFCFHLRWFPSGYVLWVWFRPWPFWVGGWPGGWIIFPLEKQLAALRHLFSGGKNNPTPRPANYQGIVGERQQQKNEERKKQSINSRYAFSGVNRAWGGARVFSLKKMSERSELFFREKTLAPPCDQTPKNEAPQIRAQPPAPDPVHLPGTQKPISRSIYGTPD